LIESRPPARDRFGPVVLQVLGKIDIDAGKIGFEPGQISRRQGILGETRSPLLGRLGRREKFRVEESRRVSPVIRTALLRYDGLDLRKLAMSARMRLT